MFLLLALALGIADAAEVCASVEVQGRPLPLGYVSLKGGPSERSLVRFKDGKFCLYGVKRGSYTVSVQPLEFPFPELPLRSNRISVEDKPLRLKLEHADPKDTATARLSGTLHFRGDAPLDLKADPVLLAAQIGTPDGTTRYHFKWIDAGGRKTAYTLPAAPGRLFHFQARAKAWSIELTEPGLWSFEGQTLRLDAGKATALDLFLHGGPKLIGTVRLPDGTPFKPYNGAKDEKRSVFWLRVEGLLDYYDHNAIADEKGTVELPSLRPGMRYVIPKHLGDGFVWSTGLAWISWIEPGRDLARDVQLFERSEVRVAKAEGLKPLPPLAHSEDLERRVIGFEAGRFGAQEVSRLFFHDEAPISLIHTPQGRWQPFGFVAPPDRPVGSLPPPGRYDLFLVETANPIVFPSVWVRQALRDVSLPREKVRSIDLRAPYYPEGAGTLAGSFSGKKVTDLAAIRATDSISELHTVIAPRVNLFDSQGRYVGSAFSAISMEDLHAMNEALSAGDANKIDALFNNRKRGFQIGRLAPGDYRVELAAAGYPKKEFKVTIAENQTARLDIDLDSL